MKEELCLSGWISILMTLLVGLLLMLLPLPRWAMGFQPSWLLLILAYWAIALPHRVGITIAWCAGLLLDVLQGTLLGENALAFVVVIYIAVKLHRQIRMFSLVGQAIILFLLLFINQLLVFWIQGLHGQMLEGRWLWGPPLVGACLWPWLFLILTDYLRRYRLY